MSTKYILVKRTKEHVDTYVSFTHDAGHVQFIKDDLLHESDATRLNTLEQAVKISNRYGPYAILKVVTTTRIEEV